MPGRAIGVGAAPCGRPLSLQCSPAERNIDISLKKVPRPNRNGIVAVRKVRFQPVTPPFRLRNRRGSLVDANVRLSSHAPCGSALVMSSSSMTTHDVVYVYASVVRQADGLLSDWATDSPFTPSRRLLLAPYRGAPADCSPKLPCPSIHRHKNGGYSGRTEGHSVLQL
jgi:hypothetical protein